MTDPFEHAWKSLQADSTELPDNPHLEKRLMHELHRQQKPRSMWRNLIIAAGLLVGCFALGSGIAVAAGYNPFRTFQLILDSDSGTLTVYDENGNATKGVIVTNTSVDPDTGAMTIVVSPNLDALTEDKAKK